jgi:hypothetical protein
MNELTMNEMQQVGGGRLPKHAGNSQKKESKGFQNSSISRACFGAAAVVTSVMGPIGLGISAVLAAVSTQ